MLQVDLNQTAVQAAIAPSLGTPVARTSADNFTTAQFVQVANVVCDAITNVDRLRRPISSGHSIPRPDATWLQQSYSNPRLPLFFDTQAQFSDRTAQQNAFADWVSMHFYAGSDMARWNFTDPNDPDGVMGVAANIVMMLGLYRQ